MHLSEMLRPETVSVSLQAEDKPGVISELIDLIERAWPGLDRGAISRAVFAREELISTGIGNGIAIPHAKVEGVPAMLFSVGLKKGGLDFRALDDQPATIFFMVIAPKSPEATELHLQVMARISRILKNQGFCESLFACSGPEELIERIAQEEGRFV